MAGDWIKIEHGLPGKPEVMELARIMGIDEMSVVGHLVCFWSWVDQNLSPDCPSVNGTKTGLNRVAGRDGFVDAMVEVGWLKFDGQAVTVPNYHYHLSESAKKRAVESRKKQLQRKVSRKCPASAGTESGQKQGPEERRVEKRVTTGAGRTLEHIIPKKLDDAECHAAAAKWFAFLESKGLDDKNPDGNEIALEEWWRQMGKLTRADFLEAVSESIAAQRWNVTKNRSRGESGNGKTNGTHLSPEFLKAYDVFRKHVGGDKIQIRKDELGPILYEAGKRTTAAEFQRADDSFGKRDVALIFEQHLADVKKEAGS